VYLVASSGNFSTDYILGSAAKCPHSLPCIPLFEGAVLKTGL
jgi:hypothetical protein